MNKLWLAGVILVLPIVAGCNKDSGVKESTTEKAATGPKTTPAPEGTPSPTPTPSQPPTFGETPKSGKSVTIAVGASAARPIDELAEQFRRTTGIEVSVQPGRATALAEQIVDAADADLLLADDVTAVDYLQSRDAVDRRVDLLENRLVLVVPADKGSGVAKPQDLTNDAVVKIAIPKVPESPAGRHARKALSDMQLWDKLQDKIVPVSDGGEAVNMVGSGLADAAFALASDVIGAKGVKAVAEISPDQAQPIVCWLLLIKTSAGKEPTQKFFQYLTSPEAAKIFRKHGFKTPTDRP